MKAQIIYLAAQWKADLVIIEDTSSGMGLLQLLREQPLLNVIGRHPTQLASNDSRGRLNTIGAQKAALM